MFDRLYNRCYNRHYNRPIVPQIHIKLVHSSLSYQQAIHKKYGRRGRQSPSGYDPKVSIFLLNAVRYAKVI